MMALYVNDKHLNPEVRQLIDNAIWFSSSGTERIQAGVAASLEQVLKDSADPRLKRLVLASTNTSTSNSKIDHRQEHKDGLSITRRLLRSADVRRLLFCSPTNL